VVLHAYAEGDASALEVGHLESRIARELGSKMIYFLLFSPGTIEIRKVRTRPDGIEMECSAAA
jgi:hypothetical protein